MSALPIARVDELVLRYVPLRALGPPARAGTLPRTFLALDRRTGEPAVVALSAEPPRDGAEGHFTRELQAARGTGGRVRAALLDGGVLEDRAWVASAWTPGLDLSFLLSTGRAGIEVALPVLWQVSAALADLHGRGLVHGDLHPRNVRLTPGGEIVLVGFAPGPVGGPLKTPSPDQPVQRYAPPEFLAGNLSTAPGDVYSLALLVYELFAGAPLLPAGTAAQTLANEQALGADLPRRLEGKGLPPRLVPVVARMLAVSPSDRPATGAELHDALVGLVPDWTAPSVLVRVPPERLAAAAARARARHLAEARKDLAAGARLSAASHLEAFAELSEGAGEELEGEFTRLVEDALWQTFLDPGGPEGSRGRVEAEVLGCLLVWASSPMQASGHAELAALRLTALVPPASPLARLVPLPPPAPDRARRVEGLTRFLSRHPADPRGLLWLAALTPGFAAPAGTRAARLKVDLLVRHGLPAAALVHLGDELAARPGDPALLRETKDLAERALGKAPAPPPGAEEPHPHAELAAGEARTRSLARLRRVTALPATPPPPAATKAPVARPVRIGLPPPDQPLTMEDAQILFDTAQGLGQDGLLEPAVDAFHRLLTAGELERARFKAVCVEELRHLVWVALMEPERRRPPGTLLRLAELVRLLGMTRLVGLLQTLWLAAAPREQVASTIEVLVSQDPWSLPLLAAAVRVAKDPRDRARLAATLAREAGQVGAIAIATRALAEARDLAPDLEAVQAAAGAVEAARSEDERAAAAFQELEREFATGHEDPELVGRCETFLKAFPHHLPALFRRAELAEKAGDRPRAARLHWQLAGLALVMEQPDLARRHLRGVLAVQPEDDDALAYLASLDQPARPRSGRILDMKIDVLRREGLTGVAVLQLRKSLSGGPGDDETHGRLVELCREAGQDPSPHLLAQGAIKLGQGKEKEARALFEAAVAAATDKDHVIDQLVHTPGVAALIPRSRLEAMRPAREP